MCCHQDNTSGKLDLESSLATCVHGQVSNHVKQDSTLLQPNEDMLTSSTIYVEMWTWPLQLGQRSKQMEVEQILRHEFLDHA